MMHLGDVVITGQTTFGLGQGTFGRDSAMFESLIGFVAELSLVLWALVVLTVVIRFVGMRFYRRDAVGTALVAGTAPGTALESAAMPSMRARTGRIQPAAVAEFAGAPHGATRTRRNARVDALTSSSTKA